MFIGIFLDSFEFDGSFGPSKAYIFKSCYNEDQAIIFGSAVLNTKLKQVDYNNIVRIEYIGKKQGKRGQYKDFRVCDKPQ